MGRVQHPNDDQANSLTNTMAPRVTQNTPTTIYMKAKPLDSQMGVIASAREGIKEFTQNLMMLVMEVKVAIAQFRWQDKRVRQFGDAIANALGDVLGELWGQSWPSYFLQTCVSDLCRYAKHVLWNPQRIFNDCFRELQAMVQQSQFRKANATPVDNHLRGHWAIPSAHLCELTSSPLTASASNVPIFR